MQDVCQPWWVNRENQHALKENQAIKITTYNSLFSSISSMPTSKPKPMNKGFTQLQGIKGIHFSSFRWLLFSLKVVDENVRQGPFLSALLFVVQRAKFHFWVNPNLQIKLGLTFEGINRDREWELGASKSQSRFSIPILWYWGSGAVSGVTLTEDRDQDGIFTIIINPDSVVRNWELEKSLPKQFTHWLLPLCFAGFCQAK